MVVGERGRGGPRRRGQAWAGVALLAASTLDEAARTSHAFGWLPATTTPAPNRTDTRVRLRHWPLSRMPVVLTRPSPVRQTV